MLCVLVKILSFDDVTCLGSGTRHCQVSYVAGLRIDTLTGPLPAGTRCESVRAGSRRPGVVSPMSSHAGCDGFGMANLCVRAGGQFARHDRGCGSELFDPYVFSYCQNGWHLCEIASRPLAGCATEDETSQSVPCPSWDRANGRRPFKEGATELRGEAGSLEVGASSTSTILRISRCPTHGRTKGRSLRASEYT
jgi:hypothetical protein